MPAPVKATHRAVFRLLRNKSSESSTSIDYSQRAFPPRIRYYALPQKVVNVLSQAKCSVRLQSNISKRGQAMENINRRRFLQVSVAAGAAGLVPGIPAAAAQPRMRLGIIIGVERDADAALKRVHDFGVP